MTAFLVGFRAYNSPKNSSAIFGIVVREEVLTAFLIYFGLREILWYVFGEIFNQFVMFGDNDTKRIFGDVGNFVFRLYGEIFGYIVYNGFVEISHFIEKFGVVCNENSRLSRKQGNIFFCIGVERDVFVREERIHIFFDRRRHEYGNFKLMFGNSGKQGFTGKNGVVYFKEFAFGEFDIIGIGIGKELFSVAGRDEN